jgi:hypothetical protein
VTINDLSQADLNTLMNEYVQPTLARRINRQSVESNLAKTLQKTSVNGKYHLKKAQVGGNFRAEARLAGSIIPGLDGAVGVQDNMATIKTVYTQWQRKRVYKTTDASGESFIAPKNGAGVVKELAKFLLDDVYANIPEDDSRMLATGQLGILAEIESISGNVVTVRAAKSTNAGTAAVSRPWAGNRFIREGMVLDCIKSAAGVPNPVGALRLNTEAPNNEGRQVVDISDDGDTATITFDDLSGNAWAGGTNTPGDLLVAFRSREGVTGGVSTQAQWYGMANPFGIMDCIQTGTDAFYAAPYMGNLQVSANRFMQSFNVNNASNDALTPDMVNRLYEKSAMDGIGSNKWDMIYCTPSVYRLCARNLTAVPSSGMSTNNPIRINNPGSEKVALGVRGIKLNVLNTETGEMNFVTSRFAPHYRAYVMDKNELEVMEEMPWGPVDDDGRQAQSYFDRDGVIFKLRKYTTGMVTSSSRRAGGVITGLSGDQNSASA